MQNVKTVWNLNSENSTNGFEPVTLSCAAQQARFRIIDAEQSVDGVAAQIEAHVADLIRRWRG